MVAGRGYRGVGRWRLMTAKRFSARDLLIRAGWQIWTQAILEMDMTVNFNPDDEVRVELAGRGLCDAELVFARATVQHQQQAWFHGFLLRQKKATFARKECDARSTPRAIFGSKSRMRSLAGTNKHPRTSETVRNFFFTRRLHSLESCSLLVLSDP